ncbi:hypothetical protein Noca_4710 (plasmid) [Nocardioides sp. JS614]|nr:hypothetical protein Noca_4710 [Nocardioides sp. JS614]
MATTPPGRPGSDQEPADDGAGPTWPRYELRPTGTGREGCPGAVALRRCDAAKAAAGGRPRRWSWVRGAGRSRRVRAARHVGSAGKAIDPLTVKHAFSSSPRVTTGEW